MKMVNFLLPIAYKLVDSAVKKIPDDAETWRETD